MKNFAMTGVAGYVAPRHLKAISDTGNRLLAAFDPHDSVGVLDRYQPGASFFTEFERFDRHLEMLRRGNDRRIDYLSICSPNHLHDAHIRLAMRLGADAICEKPLVLNPWNLDALAQLEAESGAAVKTVLQLRVHPTLVELRRELAAAGDRRHRVQLSYVTPRGPWYRYSWKGDEKRSGGVITNVGIHFFDLLIWLFGPVVSFQLHQRTAQRAAGDIELERADVGWFLSIDAADLPGAGDERADLKAGTTHRSLTIDGREVDFTGGFTDLHTRVYEDIMAGGGYGIEDARPSIEMVYALRHAEPTQPDRGEFR